LKFLRSTILTFSTSLFVFIFNAIIAVSKARFLGPSGKGTLTIIMAYLGILVLIGNMGIGLASVFYLGQKKYSFDEIVTNAITYALFLSIGLILIGYFGSLALRNLFLKDIPPRYIFLSLVIIPSYLSNLYLSRIILGLQRIELYNLFSVLEALLTAILLIIFLMYTPNVLNAILATLFSSLLMTIIGSILIRKISGRVIKFKANLSLFKESFQYGVKAQVANLMQFLNYRLDIFLVNYFVNPAAVGIYSVAVSLAESFWRVANSVATVLFPYSSMVQDEIQLSKFTAKACRIGFLITLLLILFIMPFVSLLIRSLFGESFITADKPFLILLPGILFYTVTSIVSSYFAGRGKPGLNAIISSIAFIITILFDILLIPGWGILGASVATSLSYVISMVATVIFFNRFSKLNLKEILVIKRNDFSFISFLSRTK